MPSASTGGKRRIWTRPQTDSVTSGMASQRPPRDFSTTNSCSTPAFDSKGLNRVVVVVGAGGEVGEVDGEGAFGGDGCGEGGEGIEEVGDAGDDGGVGEQNVVVVGDEKNGVVGGGVCVLDVEARGGGPFLGDGEVVEIPAVFGEGGVEGGGGGRGVGEDEGTAVAVVEGDGGQVQRGDEPGEWSVVASENGGVDVAEGRIGAGRTAELKAEGLVERGGGAGGESERQDGGGEEAFHCGGPLGCGRRGFPGLREQG